MSKKKAIQEKKMKREFTFELTEKEVVTYARKTATLTKQRNDIEAEFNNIKSTFKAKIDEKETEIASLLQAIEKGSEIRLTECIERKDFNKEVVEYVAGSKILETRDMTEEEKQMELNLDKATTEKAKRGDKNKPGRSNLNLKSNPVDPETQKQRDLNDVIRDEKSKHKKDLVNSPLI